jgi:hypothetical protein
MQEMELAFARALFKAGSSIAARIAIIAITTKSSISVKYVDERRFPYPVNLLFTFMIFSFLLLQVIKKETGSLPGELTVQ